MIPPDHLRPKNPAIAWWCVGLVVIVIVALLPWWRNHSYLRNFYDYGLVMAATGRIAAGEMPYVDFLTPIQTGTFLFNGWAERLGDGTFQAMTRGAAFLTVVSAILLALILRRRWSIVPAITVAGALTCMTMSQHTILWYNSVGAICLAVAVWTAAMAPVVRRSQWAWHGLTAGALFVSGITKLNAHLVTLVGVAAWAVWAGVQGKASKRQVIVMLGWIGLFSIILPVGVELAWTHASLGAWWKNVVAIPFSSRSGDLVSIFHAKFYLHTRHDYYGPMPLHSLGAVGVLVTAGFAWAGVRAHGWNRSGWVFAAALFAAMSGAALLATNFEIVYVAMGAWFALIAALWIGFELRCSGPFFFGGFVLPVFFVGVIAWHSAWLGQRSQFGYSESPRSAYVPGDASSPDLHYLHGTLLPPEASVALTDTGSWRDALSAEGKKGVFYGPGLEWLERIWPVTKMPGMPLWMHGGVSYGEKEVERLREVIAHSGVYNAFLVSEAQDWRRTYPVLGERFSVRRLGRVWFLNERLRRDVVSWKPLDFRRVMGGNVNSVYLYSTMAMHSLGEARDFIGVTKGVGEMQLGLPTNRAQGEAVLQRLPGQTVDSSVPVRFEVFSMADGNLYPRWSADLKMPEGESALIVPFPIDCGGSPLQFRVTVPSELSDTVAAGWRGLQVLHSVDGPKVPPPLRIGLFDEWQAKENERKALLPENWSPGPIYLRNSRVGAQGLELSPGGEIWIRLSGRYAEISGVATAAFDPAHAENPVVNILFLKGPKLEVMQRAAIAAPNQVFNFKAWSAEDDGWLVIQTEPYAQSPVVAIRINSVSRN